MDENNDGLPRPVEDLLRERGARYGSFKGHAEISQGLKNLIYIYASDRGTNLAADQREALCMICHKIARVINGDPDYEDSWVDIAGYAHLIVERLRGKVV